MYNHSFSIYKKRNSSFQGIFQVEDWHFKVYNIWIDERCIEPELHKAFEKLLTALMPDYPVNDSRYGVGFAIMHKGADGNYALISWWEGENMLCHHVYCSLPLRPFEFRSMLSSHIVACVWELEIIYFEKMKWVEMVLGGTHLADFGGYLAASYTGKI